jgi:hypothetical protein
MQSIRDAAILLILILLVASVRIGPSNEAPQTLPAESAVDTGVPLPAMRLAPPPARDAQGPHFEGEEGQEEILPMEAERDRKLQATLQHCPTDPDWPRETHSAGPTC